LLHVIEQSPLDTPYKLIEQPAPPEEISTQEAGLLIVRILLGILYLLYSLVRRPEICFVSNTNLLRKVNWNGQHRFRDIYLDDVADGLREKGWRVTFIEKYGQNATWKGLLARGFFFPNDLIFFLSAVFWRRLGLRKGQMSRWRKTWQAVSGTLQPPLH
jgi:hypothetical protein